MKRQRLILYFFLFVCIINAQEERNKPKKSIIKANLTSLTFGNAQFSYELALFKSISLGVGYGTSLSDKLPSVSITKFNLNESPIIELWDYFDGKLNEFLFEARVYLGQGYGKGLYTGVFYQASLLKINEVPVSIFVDEPPLAGFGNLYSNSYGLLLGAQFNLGRHFVLDVFLNPKYSIIDGTLAAFSNTEWSGAKGQNSASIPYIFNEEDFVPLGGGEFGVQTVTSFVPSGLSGIVFGSFIDMRMGINLGFRF